MFQRSYYLLAISIALVLLARSPLTEAALTDVYIMAPFTDFTIEKGEPIEIPMSLVNNSDELKTVSFKVEVPKGWKFKLDVRGFNATDIVVGPRDDSFFDFQLIPPEDVKEGTYKARIMSLVEGRPIQAIDFNVKVIIPEAKVEMTSDYPDLEGPSGSTFVYSFDLKNLGAHDLTFALTAEKVPQGWTVSFKPSTFEDKIISSITIEAGRTAFGLVAEVKSPKNAPPGIYEIIIKASAEGIEKFLRFRAFVTGVHELSLKTPTGLVSLSIVAGEMRNVTLTLSNTGNARLEDVRISIRAPRGWTLVYPTVIPSLEPEASKDIVVGIKPNPNAIAGDYLVTVTASSPLAGTDEVELRVTVTKGMGWGLVGIGVIVAVVFVLIFVFRRYGRA